jgi:hypothetical protein
MKLASILLAGMLLQAAAAEPGAEEYQVKGAFLLNFAKFVEWPGTAFQGPTDPIQICILGANPFAGSLEIAARQLLVDRRRVSVTLVPDIRQARQCHIVFVSIAERRRARGLIEALRAESVLTVGESEDFVAGGGIIELRVVDSKVRMEISAEAAKKAGLRISAKLMSLAQAGRK